MAQGAQHTATSKKNMQIDQTEQKSHTEHDELQNSLIHLMEIS